MEVKIRIYYSLAKKVILLMMSVNSVITNKIFGTEMFSLIIFKSLKKYRKK